MGEVARFTRSEVCVSDASEVSATTEVKFAPLAQVNAPSGH